MAETDDLIWKEWEPGDELYAVGWEAPDGSRIWSVSPSRHHAGCSPHWNELLQRFDGGIPEAAARTLVDAYERSPIYQLARAARMAAVREQVRAQREELGS